MKQPTIFCEVVAETNQMCGVAVLKGFKSYRGPWDDDYEKLNSLRFKGNQTLGTGFVQAGFVDTLICKQAYKLLSFKWPLVFQSEVRKNKRTGNKFFFAVFDVKNPKK